MINQANRRPGHATNLSTRPVETIRPHIYLPKNSLSDETTITNFPFYHFYLIIQLFFEFFRPSNQFSIESAIII